eukprot:4455486-Prymnesium_polylepis.1
MITWSGCTTPPSNVTNVRTLEYAYPTNCAFESSMRMRMLGGGEGGEEGGGEGGGGAGGGEGGGGAGGGEGGGGEGGGGEGGG